MVWDAQWDAPMLAQTLSIAVHCMKPLETTSSLSVSSRFDRRVLRHHPGGFTPKYCKYPWFCPFLVAASCLHKCQVFFVAQMKDGFIIYSITIFSFFLR